MGLRRQRMAAKRAQVAVGQPSGEALVMEPVLAGHHALFVIHLVVHHANRALVVVIP